MKQKTQVKGVLILLLTAFIWGSAFVAQSVGMESVGSFTFSCVRTLLGALVLVPVILARDISALKKQKTTRQEIKAQNIKALKCGAILGTVLCAAINFQQASFLFPDATAGKVAFITGMYMFCVPVVSLVLFKKRMSPLTWLSVALGIFAMYLLCISPEEGFAVSPMCIVSFCGSLCYTGHILLIERFSKQVDGIKLSCVQFFTASLISAPLMFIFDSPSLSALSQGAIPILYAGVFSCGIAFTLQIVGQKYTESTLASLIMCTESVFAVLTGWIILHDVMSPRETAGCVIMFTGIILSVLADGITAKIKSLLRKS